MHRVEPVRMFCAPISSITVTPRLVAHVQHRRGRSGTRRPGIGRPRFTTCRADKLFQQVGIGGVDELAIGLGAAQHRHMACRPAAGAARGTAASTCRSGKEDSRGVRPLEDHMSFHPFHQNLPGIENRTCRVSIRLMVEMRRPSALAPAQAGCIRSGRHEGAMLMEITSVGVVGAGQMGNGIAHVMALAGYNVLLNDISDEALAAAMATIDRNIDRQVTRGKVDAPTTRPRRWRGSAPRRQLADLGQADLVIEAATEKEAVKQAIFAELLPHLKPADDPDLEHLVDLDHPAGQPHRPAGEVHGVPFHEPGAGDAAGRADPRHRHRRRRPMTPAARWSRSWARPRRWPRISRPSSSTAS